MIGGLHLVVAKDEEIARIATLMHGTYRVGSIAPGHCTGEPTFKALQAAFGDRDLYAGVGSRIAFGAMPRLPADNLDSMKLDSIATGLLSYVQALDIYPIPPATAAPEYLHPAYDCARLVSRPDPAFDGHGHNRGCIAGCVPCKGAADSTRTQPLGLHGCRGARQCTVGRACVGRLAYGRARLKWYKQYSGFPDGAYSVIGAGSHPLEVVPAAALPMP